MSNFEDLSPDLGVNGSPINGCCECSAGGIVNLGASQTGTFKVETPKSQSSPSESKRGAGDKAKPLTLHIERLAYQSGRKRLSSRDYLMAPALRVTLTERESKNEAKEREGEDSYHSLYI